MQNIKTIQYIAVGLLGVLFVEMPLTMGECLNFESYTAGAWVAQILAVIATVTIAIRVAHIDE